MQNVKKYINIRNKRDTKKTRNSHNNVHGQISSGAYFHAKMAVLVFIILEIFFATCMVLKFGGYHLHISQLGNIHAF